MKFKILGALIVAPMIVFSGVALSGDGTPDQQGMDAISITPTTCIIYFDDTTAVTGVVGRVFVKFDVMNEPLTVSANCTVREFFGEFSSDPFSKEDFPCYVQITKAGAGHFYQILDPNDPEIGGEVTNRKRFRNGKATLSCSGPYTG